MALYTATSWADLITKFGLATSSGDEVFMDFATASGTAQALWEAPPNAILRGRGDTEVDGGDDLTVITDNMAADSPLLKINVSATGTFTAYGFSIVGGSGGNKNGGMWNIGGPGTVKIGNVTLDSKTYSPSQNNKVLLVGGLVYGVIYNSILNLSGTSAIYPYNGDTGNDQGNAVWAADTNFGESNFFVIEDTDVNGSPSSHDSRVVDGFTAARFVVRFCNLSAACISESHATGHSTDDRGTRAHEAYCNYSVEGPDQDDYEPNFVLDDISSGCSLIWGNTIIANAYKNVFGINVTRKAGEDTGGTYDIEPPPDGWGYAGPSPQTGTVNTSGTTVTKATGSNFNVSWPADLMIVIAGTTYRIVSVDSTTQITVAASAGTQTGATYVLGSAWDGNTDFLGYPCLDQPGRGRGDLLTGLMPDKVNDTTDDISWPNQALEPVYIWKNVGTFAAGWGGSYYSNSSGGRVTANRDYYPQASGIQTNATTPFDGTVGCGWGTLANRPTTCTTGVGYFATDQGSWNTTGSNSHGTQMSGASGLLYVATATNTWTLYYTPLEYPHPLRDVAPETQSPAVMIPMRMIL